MARLIRGWLFTMIFLLFFIFIISDMALWKSLLSSLFPDLKEVVYPRAGLAALVGEHLILVVLSSGAAIIIGILLGIFVTRRVGRAFLEIVSDISSLSQTIPPVAVLALAVPLAGFGVKPTVLALFLYSILPLVRNTITGLETVGQDKKQAALGMGMTRLQLLLRIELPLALPLIMAGIRIAVVINIGTATLGAVVGAGGLGTPIVAGLVRENPAFVLEGALCAALLALLFDRGITQVERSLFKKLKSAPENPSGNVLFSRIPGFRRRSRLPARPAPRPHRR
jgi:osmoprotectant transport system permease protein